jgi:hypothetical protein
LWGKLVNVKELEIEKTWEAMTDLGPRSTAAQLLSLTLLITAGIWTFGSNSSVEVEAPILGVKISSKIAAELALMLGTTSYFLVSVFNSYRLLLEQDLQKLIQASDPQFRLAWSCKYPGVTTYLANIRNSSKLAAWVSLVLVLGTLFVPIGSLALLVILGCSWWRDLSFWIFAVPSVLLVVLGFCIFWSDTLTPRVRA